MSLQRFGEFLINITNGRITGDHIQKALLQQKSFAQGHKLLGEILVENKVITKEELDIFLKKFEELLLNSDIKVKCL